MGVQKWYQIAQRIIMNIKNVSVIVLVKYYNDSVIWVRTPKHQVQ